MKFFYDFLRFQILLDSIVSLKVPHKKCPTHQLDPSQSICNRALCGHGRPVFCKSLLSTVFSFISLQLLHFTHIFWDSRGISDRYHHRSIRNSCFLKFNAKNRWNIDLTDLRESIRTIGLLLSMDLNIEGFFFNKN